MVSVSEEMNFKLYITLILNSYRLLMANILGSVVLGY